MYAITEAARWLQQQQQYSIGSGIVSEEYIMRMASAAVINARCRYRSNKDDDNNENMYCCSLLLLLLVLDLSPMLQLYMLQNLDACVRACVR